MLVLLDNDALWFMPAAWGSAKERRRYIVASPLIGWAYSQNNPCILISINSLRPDQNDQHFTCGILKCIFLDENYNI